jgi:type III secretory pathway component EscT
MSDGYMKWAPVIFVVIMVVVVFFANGGMDIIADAVEELHDLVPKPTSTPTPAVEYLDWNDLGQKKYLIVTIAAIFAILFVYFVLIPYLRDWEYQ